MTRFTKVLAVAAALVALPSIASAVSLNIINVSGSGADGTMGPGETVTFDLAIDWTGLATAPYLVSADVSGYDAPDITGERQFGLALQSGSGSADVLNTLFVPALPTLVSLGNGVPNVNPGGAASESFIVNNLNPLAWTTNAFSGILSPVAPAPPGDGSEDIGLGGNLVNNGAGDIHMTVTFVNVHPAAQATPTSTVLNFDLTLADVNGDPIASTGSSFALTTVPEPGTALLMGLGLAGLATTRRR